MKKWFLVTLNIELFLDLTSHTNRDWYSTRLDYKMTVYLPHPKKHIVLSKKGNDKIGEFVRVTSLEDKKKGLV